MSSNISPKLAFEPKILSREFKGDILYFRSDGYIDLRRLVEAFGISVRSVADCLHCFSMMVTDVPTWKGPLLAGVTKPITDSHHVWIPHQVFNHLGASLVTDPDFSYWYAEQSLSIPHFISGGRA